MSDKTLRDNLRDAPAPVKLLWVLLLLFVAVLTIKMFGIGGIIITIILLRYTHKAFTEPEYKPSGLGSSSKH